MYTIRYINYKNVRNNICTSLKHYEVAYWQSYIGVVRQIRLVLNVLLSEYLGGRGLYVAWISFAVNVHIQLKGK